MKKNKLDEIEEAVGDALALAEDRRERKKIFLEIKDISRSCADTARDVEEYQACVLDETENVVERLLQRRQRQRR